MSKRKVLATNTCLQRPNKLASTDSGADTQRTEIVHLCEVYLVE